MVRDRGREALLAVIIVAEQEVVLLVVQDIHRHIVIQIHATDTGGMIDTGTVGQNLRAHHQVDRGGCQNHVPVALYAIRVLGFKNKSASDQPSGKTHQIINQSGDQDHDYHYLQRMPSCFR